MELHFSNILLSSSWFVGQQFIAWLLTRKDNYSCPSFLCDSHRNENCIVHVFCVENILANSESLQERSGWTDHDEGCMDDLQQGPFKLLTSRRVPILLRRDPRRGLSSGRGNHLCYLHDSNVSRSPSLGRSIVVVWTCALIIVCTYVHVCLRTSPRGMQETVNATHWLRVYARRIFLIHDDSLFEFFFVINKFSIS